MKVKNIIIIFTLMAATALTLSSCNDFLTIYPTDKTTGKDFWKNKDQVVSMVNGAYSAMLSSGVQERAIIWGAYRSDELEKRQGYSHTNLANISAANLLPSNGYNNWADYYSVINRCNIVLNHADQVVATDPQFTQGDCNQVKAEMLALRSLCYFYLVRAFRDVPYTSQSYEDDEQNMEVAQSSPDSVLQNCLNDLNTASQYIMRSGAYGQGDSRNWGRFTRDAVWTLMADIYLWRASMKLASADPASATADYQQCIEYCDKVIKSKDAYYRANYSSFNMDASDIYHLNPGFARFVIGSYMFPDLFVLGNSHESILEWQYDQDVTPNYGLQNLYYRISSSDANSQLMATTMFSGTDGPSSDKVYLNTNDARYWDNIYGVGSVTAKEFSVRKYCTMSFGTVYASKGNSTIGPDKQTGITSYDHYGMHWIVYRLSDVILMKAEALVQLATDDSDPVLGEAFNLVKVINDRSWIAPAIRNPQNNTIDSLRWSTYSTKEGMDRLVLAERERELCFEGKRWFDLVRYCYRHMRDNTVKVDPTRLMADQGTLSAPLSDEMLKLMTRKFVDTGGESVIYKMKNEAFLYFPLLRSEVKVNHQLKQNPAWAEEETISKQ